MYRTMHTRIIQHEDREKKVNFNQIKNEIKFTRLKTGFEKLLEQYLNKSYMHVRMCIEHFPKQKGTYETCSNGTQKTREQEKLFPIHAPSPFAI